MEHGHLATIISSSSHFGLPELDEALPSLPLFPLPFDLLAPFPLCQLLSPLTFPLVHPLEFGFQSQPLPVNRHNSDAFPFKALTGQFKPVPTQTHGRAPRALVDDGSKDPGASGPDGRLHQVQVTVSLTAQDQV